MKKHFYLISILMLGIISSSFASTPKIEAWDFGAQQLDNEIYNNNLTEAVINAWYPGITPGTSAKNVPSAWTAGALTWTSNSATSDRLRTSNTAITRYDGTGAPFSFGTETLTGSLYVNGSAQIGRFFTITANEDDEISIYCKSQNASGTINFVNSTNIGQADTQFSSSTGNILKFYAKSTGNFKIYDSQDKPFYYRILKKAALYQNLTGTVDISEAADIPAGYKIVFTNQNAKSWAFTTTANTYNANLPVGFVYSISLQDANGYIITSTKTLDLLSSTTVFNLQLKKVDLYTVTGSILNLSTDINKLNLVFTPTVSSTYIAEPTINKTAGTYSVDLENGLSYNISATGINDYFLADNTITIAGTAATKDLDFAKKPTYAVTINTSGLTQLQESKLQLTFTNLNENGYSYAFGSIAGIALRSGTYTVKTSGIDEYPYILALNSNLKVENAIASKTLTFKKVNNWSFDDQVISSATSNYKGMIFTGNIANEQAKGHLTAKAGATIAVPMAVGEKLIVTYYYAADFSIDGGTAISTSSSSTSTFESTEYLYTGNSDGFVNISIGSAASTTYITDITTVAVVPYAATIYVGTNKSYKTINEALTAVSRMNRPNSERVTIMVDPGNYEEMLVVNQANISLKNAAQIPNIALSNAGVDIDASAVRITSYYGHGYNYYSMGNDQKWNAETQTVNKENAYISYVNTGSGTTNGSYWNATVVLMASGFEADDIIFENSFNQYISQKESQDIVQEWSIGGKGTRPTNVGNTAVQNKSFVERAAALAIANNVDKVVLKKCRIIGRQDSFYGGTGSRVLMYKGTAMGGTDYIFGGMTAVFYKTDLAMNTSETNTDVCYITAAQQSSGRGYLMYECNITSAQPGTETASQYLSKPGYFGRPWQANTSEVVFYNSNIGKTNNPDYADQSYILPVGWMSSLGGESAKMYEYGSMESANVNNNTLRASWATQLNTATLTDGTAITPFNFTKGSDNWDPIPALLQEDMGTKIASELKNSNIRFIVNANKIAIQNVHSDTTISVYAMDGSLLKSIRTANDTNFNIAKGLWIIKAENAEGKCIAKILAK